MIFFCYWIESLKYYGFEILNFFWIFIVIDEGVKEKRYGWLILIFFFFLIFIVIGKGVKNGCEILNVFLNLNFYWRECLDVLGVKY